MPDAFAVSTTTTSITLDEARAPVAAAFGVVNLTGHAVRARGVAVPGPETTASWLPVAGEAERDFPLDGRDDYVVDVTVPPDVPGGTYTFRFHVVSVTLPDEESGQSELISIVVPDLPEPPPPPVPEEPPGYLETLAGALMGAFVVGVILGAIGLALALTADLNTGGGGGGGGDLGSVIGEIIAEAIGLLILIVIITVLFGALGFWLGPVIGALIVLKARGFRDPWRTALPMVLLIPLLGLPILLLLGRLSDVIGLEGNASLLVGVFSIALGVTVASLLARAYARWRQTGHF